MKNRIIYMTIAATLLLAGCSREPATDALRPGGEPLLFSGTGAPSTRTTVDTDAERRLTIAWAEADEVGIYGLSDGRPTGRNFPYVATPLGENPAQCTFSAKESATLFKWIGNTAQGYYAYYPYTEVKDREPDAAAHPFSLPAEQVQDKADSPAHIAKYGLMTATPVQIAASDKSPGGIRFEFANIFSIVELRFRMTSDCSLASVPVKRVGLISEAADLAIPAGTVDLTRPVAADAALPVAVDEGSRSVAAVFGTNPGLGKGQYTSVYLVVAPGNHPAGSLRFEVTAIDNSVYAFTIPEAVAFRPNRHYTRTYELSLDGFVQADPFEADIPVLSCKAGEPLTVDMTGVADRIEFWSGEEGHDYAYADKDRMQSPAMSMNFLMLLQNGYQRTPVKVKYSTDFDGTMNEESILAATWNDVTSLFDIPTHLVGVDDNKTASNSTPANAGVADCSAWFTGEGGTCHIALFYHIDKFDAAWVDPVIGAVTGNGRTYFYLFDLWVRAQYKSESSFTEVYRHKYVKNESNPEYPTVVLGATFGTEDGANPQNVYSYGSYPYVLRLGAAFRPTADKDSYVVLPRLTRPEARNVGKDSPLVVKGESDPQPATYQYVFTTPGTYRVAVVGSVQTLSGTKQIVKQATVTVTAE